MWCGLVCLLVVALSWCRLEASEAHYGLWPADIGLENRLRVANAEGSDVQLLTWSQGYSDGSRAGKKADSGNASLVGMACGLMLGGFLGTGIAWIAMDGSEVSPFVLSKIDHRGTDYVLGFKEGYKIQSRKERKEQAVMGGVAGTAILAVVYLVAIR